MRAQNGGGRRREKLQSEDLFGRFGGDEFLIGCFGRDRDAPTSR